MKREDCLFSKVNQLKIRVDGEWPNDSLYFISILVDTSNIQILDFQSHFHQSAILKIIENLIKLINRLSNISSLILLPINNYGIYNTTITTLCSILSYNIKHFHIKIEKIDQMKIILEKFKHLSSISFNLPFDRKINIDEIIDWLNINKRDFTYLEYDYSFHLWFNNDQHSS